MNYAPLTINYQLVTVRSLHPDALYRDSYVTINYSLVTVRSLHPDALYRDSYAINYQLSTINY